MDPIADALLNAARSELGYREKGGLSKYGVAYAKRVNDSQYRGAPWCDMFITWAASKAGILPWVGQFAWTPSHARWFMDQGAWTRSPEPGALVFFDWSGGKSYKGIDHVGIVESVEGSKIHTIEANIQGGKLKRMTRDQQKVVGYGLPWKVKANAATAQVRAT
ncbi:MAG: CHAP domain-containing protein, partial [Nonomuraea sp.]|nr:CHAP domain-containing protein [Nonomuraea sp.]